MSGCTTDYSFDPPYSYCPRGLQSIHAKTSTSTDPSDSNSSEDRGGQAPGRTPATATSSTIPSRTEPATDTASVVTGAPDAPSQITSEASAGPTPSTGSNGISKGAVAGIAVGTTIIGAAIASLIAFLLFKRRKRFPEHPYSVSTPDFSPLPNGKHMPYVQVSQTPAPVMAAAIAPPKKDLDLASLSNSSDFLSGVLPPAADEQTVKSKVAGLFNTIQHHVDSFYRDVHATITPTMESDLLRFGSDLVNVVETLQNSSMPTVAIKHALASYILSIISPEAEDQATLFPTEISGLKDNERSTVSPGDQAAYIIYKRLAVHLHSPNTASLQSRQSDIREAAEHFSLTFFPWANPAYNDSDKDEDLVRTISNALEISVWLYGQPFSYEFAWESVGRRGITVTPGLTRVTDSMGRPCERPKVLLEPVVAVG